MILLPGFFIEESSNDTVLIKPHLLSSPDCSGKPATDEG